VHSENAIEASVPTPMRRAVNAKLVYSTPGSEWWATSGPAGRPSRSLHQRVDQVPAGRLCTARW